MTKQLSIEEGNRLIAEFMGWQEHWSEELVPPYHSSWDWLMPVVGKINSIGGYDVIIWKADCHINDEREILFESSILTKKQTLISIVWGTIVQFIQWYQSNNRL